MVIRVRVYSDSESPVEGDSSINKGGPGSGHHGHSGLSGTHGGSTPGTGGGTGEGGEVSEVTQATSSAVNEYISKAGERPTGSIDKAVASRIEQYGGNIPPDVRERLQGNMVTTAEYLKEAGVPEEQANKIVMDMTDVVAAQEMESLSRQLGDHGIRHLMGDDDMAQEILALHPEADTPEMKAAISIAAAYHDIGYLSPESRAEFGKNHEKHSQSYFDDIVRPDIEAALGEDVANQVSHMIRTHAEPEIDWDDPVTSSLRIADNLALFHEDKLPGVFRYVPENINTLTEFANGDLSLDETREHMAANVAASDLSPEMKGYLTDASEEINPYTPDFTLGMLNGEVSNVEWEGDDSSGHLKVQMSTNRDIPSEVFDSLDLGRAQFEKFAKTYGIDPEDVWDDYHFAIVEGEVVLLETEVLGDISKSIIIIKGGPGSGHHGHAGRPGKVGGSLPSSGGGGAIEKGVMRYGDKDVAASKRVAKACDAESKQCYRNAIMGVMHEGDRYVEGYAIMRDLGDVPIEHGWVVKSDNTVIDPTLPDDDIDYVGFISIDKDKVLELAADHDLPLYRHVMDNQEYGELVREALGISKSLVRIKGGPGSGHHGHAGRPGKVGGSLPGSGSGGKVWQGEQQARAEDGSRVSRLQTGDIGERLARQALEDELGAPMQELNQGMNNAPLDMAGDHRAVEVKAGLATNGTTAQHWRATIGQPGKKEQELISKMSKGEKRQYHDRKRQAILDRKNAMLSEMSEAAGTEIKGATVGIILSEDGSRGDVYLVPGFHQRLRWDEYATEEYYLGTYENPDISKSIRIKGGPGSGHHGHAGRPGKVGGSLPGSGEGLQPWKDHAYGDIAEEVPISTIERYAEHTWRRGDSRLSEAQWDELERDISKNGIKEPLMLEYNPKNGMAILTEGNHRLAIAKRLGWSKVPVRVIRGSYAGNDMYDRSEKVPGAKILTDDYVPADLSPSDVFPKSVLKHTSVRIR